MIRICLAFLISVASFVLLVWLMPSCRPGDGGFFIGNAMFMGGCRPPRVCKDSDVTIFHNRDFVVTGFTMDVGTRCITSLKVRPR